MHSRSSYKPKGQERVSADVEDRLRWVEWIFAVLLLFMVGRLFQLQVVKGATYRVLATSQHELQESLIPERGRILVRDPVDDTLHPLATNRDAWTLYVVPRDLEDPQAVAEALVPYVVLKEGETATSTVASLVAAWTKDANDPYEPVAKELTTEQADAIQTLKLKGVGLVKGWTRFYPEQGIGGHVIGFVRTEDTGIGEGAYGIEGALNDVLAGRSGFVNAQKDAGGRRLAFRDGEMREALDGSDVVLTLDRTIQYEVCRRLQAAVKRHGADGGSVVVIHPDTGAILAMCSVPDFDPARYREVKDIQVLNNPVTFAQYEPGSVFKAFTMAIGLNRDAILPKTTYVDMGVEEIDGFKIKNSDGLAHGEQTMTQALDESLNTATIFVQRLVGREAFAAGVRAFGFGEKTEIELTPETPGNMVALDRKGEIFGATASFGQGVTVTPLQLAVGYAALGNGGMLMRPYIVSEIIHPDGTREVTKPQTVAQPLTPRASELITGMLVSAVERGHGKRAGVPGYYVAGKTGTAQVADPNGPGYLKDVTIGSFAGYAPADHPRFAMVVKIDRPRDVLWAESSAAPLWGDIAKFLLSYLHVPQERDPAETDVLPDLPLPVVPSSTESGVESLPEAG